MERLSQQLAEREQQLAEREQRGTATENDLRDTRRDLARERRINGMLMESWSDAGKWYNLERNFGPHLAEALTSLPADPRHCRYRMTGTTPARGPDRRNGYHPEFMAPDGSGLFVMLNGKVAWLHVWLQEQR
jgi:hypothetical protein